MFNLKEAFVVVGISLLPLSSPPQNPLCCCTLSGVHWSEAQSSVAAAANNSVPGAVRVSTETNRVVIADCE
jgi:hypothetical protein